MFGLHCGSLLRPHGQGGWLDVDYINVDDVDDSQPSWLVVVHQCIWPLDLFVVGFFLCVVSIRPVIEVRL